MKAEDTIYKYKSLFTDEHGAISCPYLRVPDEWIPYLEVLFFDILEYLKKDPSTDPIIFYTISEVRGTLVMDYDGGNEYLEGMLRDHLRSTSLPLKVELTPHTPLLELGFQRSLP